MRRHTITIALLLATTSARADFDPARYRKDRRARAFVKKLTGDPTAGGVRQTLEGVARGELFESRMSAAVYRELQAAGLSHAGFRAALAVSFRENRAIRMEQALREYERRGATSSIDGADSATVQLVSSIEGSKYWRSMGRPDLAAAAKKKARAIARRYGVDIQAALSTPVAYRIGTFDQPFEGDGRRRVVAIERVSGPNARSVEPQANRPKGTTRATRSNPLWWTGFQPAYLHLLYRTLPEKLVARFKADPNAKRYTIWHAGHEDASQTFLIAAIVDEAIETLRRERPEMRSFLDRLKVELVATDLGQRVMRSGRRVLFQVADGPRALKFPLVLDEMGAKEPERAPKAVQRLEAKLAANPGRAKVLIDRLVDSGKIALLMQRFLTASTEVVYRDRTPAPIYRITNRRWKIVDRENGGVLNGGAKNRELRFEFGDLTKTGLTTGKADLVVCTNVLPYLDLYGSVFRTADRQTWSRSSVGAALGKIAASMRPGGTLLVDPRSENVVRGMAEQERSEVLRAFEQVAAKVVVTRSDGITPYGEAPK